MQPNSQRGPVEEALMVEMAKRGDGEAFGQLWLRHSRRLCYAASRILRNHDDAEDVLQESFLKAYCHIHKFDDRSQFSTWITRIVINTALMSLRKRCRYVEVAINAGLPENDGHWELPDRSPDVESRYLMAECFYHLSAAIRALPPILRNVVEIRFARDGTLLEVAGATGMSLPAAKTRLFRETETPNESRPKAPGTPFSAAPYPMKVRGQSIRISRSKRDGIETGDRSEGKFDRTVCGARGRLTRML
jgi:RNA polymerase sigma-70 factor (ECF subfamily)